MQRAGRVAVSHEFKEKMDECFLAKDFHTSKMSNTTFNVKTERDESGTVMTPPERHPADLSLSPSPDSTSGVSNMSDREADSSPDVNMLDYCLSDGSAVQSPDSATSPQAHDRRVNNTSSNLNNTFLTSPVNSTFFWSDSLSTDDTGREKETFINGSEGSRSAGTSPYSSGKESQADSCEASRRGSTENDSSSVSSGEMVMRANSLCLDDQSIILLSSLDDASVFSPGDHQSLPESNLQATMLLDSGESPEDKGEVARHLGMTFTQSELFSEEDNVVTPNSEAAQSEKAGLMMTFLCETPTDCMQESCSNLLVPGAFTPDESKPSGATLAVLDTNNDICTSTPLEHLGDRRPKLPSLAHSPCIENAGSSGLQIIQQQPNSAPRSALAAEMPPPAGKIKKSTIKKFPKADFSGIKSKVVTRNLHQAAVQASASQRRSQFYQSSKHAEAHGAAARLTPAKVKSSVVSKMASDAQRRATGRPDAVTAQWAGQSEARVAPEASAAPCTPASSETEPPVPGQAADAAEEHIGNQTFCVSSSEKSHVASGQTDPEAALKKGVSSKIQVRPGSAVAQDRRPALRTRPRCTSESSTSSCRTPLRSRATLGSASVINTPRADAHLDQSKGPAKDSRAVKRISLVAESSRSSTAGASWDEGKNSFRANASPRQTRGAHSSQAAAASPRPARLSSRPRDESRISRPPGTPMSKKNPTGDQRVQAAGEPSLGSALATSIKTHLNGSRAQTQTPSVPPLPGSTHKAPCMLPRKTPGPARRLTEASVNTKLSEGAAGSQVSGGPARKQSPFKSAALRPQVITTPAKNARPSLAAACRPVASTSRGASHFATPLRSTAPARRTTNGPVDKNKPRAGPRQQPPQQQGSQPGQGRGPPDVVPARTGGQEQSIQNPRLPAADGCRFEALAIVLQHTLAQRDEATRQCRDLSQELVTLRGELVSSVHSSERLEKEKDELRVALEEAVQQLQEQHQKDLAELEHRLQTFYQAEWDKVHLGYQEEADRCKALMQQQMEELKASHDAMKQELESSHTEQLHSVKQQYELSLEELSKVHHQELESLDKTLKDAEAALSGQIETLTAENKALSEKLREEETRRKELAESSQKDSHTLYLEQELESLKVVLEIKNEQLHQQEKKLMEVDKLKEKNVKLDETLKKVLQQNEDLKARMDRHAALSKQLSSEQAVLQESLQKESKVNKRLSMENEELLWKLHNGDPSSPRRVSPTSTPSHTFTLQSPRSPGAFSSPPVSPR